MVPQKLVVLGSVFSAAIAAGVGLATHVAEAQTAYFDAANAPSYSELVRHPDKAMQRAAYSGEPTTMDALPDKGWGSPRSDDGSDRSE